MKISKKVIDRVLENPCRDLYTSLYLLVGIDDTFDTLDAVFEVSNGGCGYTPGNNKSLIEDIMLESIKKGYNSFIYLVSYIWEVEEYFPRRDHLGRLVGAHDDCYGDAEKLGKFLALNGDTKQLFLLAANPYDNIVDEENSYEDMRYNNDGEYCSELKIFKDHSKEIEIIE